MSIAAIKLLDDGTGCGRVTITFGSGEVEFVLGEPTEPDGRLGPAADNIAVILPG